MKSGLLATLLAATAFFVFGPREWFAQESNTRSKPNPQMKAVLDEFANLQPKPIETLTPEEARKQPTLGDAIKSLLKKQGKSTDPEPVGATKDIHIPGPEGMIPARIYQPKEKGPSPIIVYWHGGGWVLGDLDTYDASCRALCNATNSIIVSCDYRHAPEHPFPAAANDAFAAYQWVTQAAKRLGGDPGKIAVAGESAGGNLAAVTVLRAFDKGTVLPVHQLLVYPVMNYEFETPSYSEHASSKPLNRAMMKWFWGHYLKASADGSNLFASPLRAKIPAKLPSATILTAEIDPLRSEGKAYADSLKQAGVAVHYKNYDGVAHEFFGMGAVVDEGKKAVEEAATQLKRVFGEQH